jgi:CO/xanthine dehydrogenase FAD-binding subunit
MRAYLPSYEMRRARTLEEALAFLAHPAGTWRPFAGGTDLMVLLSAGTLRHQQFVSVWEIAGLRTIDVLPHAVGIGSLATFSALQRSDVLQSEFPLLCQAAREVGGIANQNRATIGGNIANASPAADAPPALLVYDAELELVSPGGSRRVPYDRFHTAYKQMDLAGDELIARIWLPRTTTKWLQEYRKVGARRAQAISKVCFAGALTMNGDQVADIRLAFGSVAPTVLRAARTEAALRGVHLTPAVAELAAESLAADLSPIDDIRSTARYRQRVASNLLRQFLMSSLP